MGRLRKLYCFLVVVLVVFIVFHQETLTKIPVLGRLRNLNYKKTNVKKPECKAKTNVVFLKTHKTGGTTLMNIVQRFGYNRNLTFVLPRVGLVYIGDYGTKLHPWNILPSPTNNEFNILCNHVTYDKLSFRKIMPNKAVYITILRHPLQRFLSAFWFYSTVYPRDYLQNVAGPDKLHTFLAHPERYETGAEYTHNSMSKDLGLDPMDFNYRKQIRRFIKEIDRDFTLVLILEHFDESLVLLKRRLCWSIKDILFIPRNTRSTFMNEEYKNNPRKISKEDSEKHKQWDTADYYLYAYFNKQFLKVVDSLGTDFTYEVKYFVHVKELVSKFCTEQKQKSQDSVLEIEESQFNSDFVVTKLDCELMLIKHEQHFTRLLIQKQYPSIQRYSSVLHYKHPHI